MSKDRADAAYEVRVAAASLARERNRVHHRANGDEQAYASANYAMSFTKGLKHGSKTGLIEDAADFRAFREAIDGGFVDPFTARVPGVMAPERPWEAPTAGLVFDLEGPDAQAVTMPPAPRLGSDELAFELAEVYELALLRDVPLTDLQAGSTNSSVAETLARLNGTAYATAGFPGRPRKTDAAGKLDAQTVFRGSSPGVERGPFVSQFLLVGTPDQTWSTGLKDGKIRYGALQIDQRVPIAKQQDYMTDWKSWLDVQNGAATQCDPDLFDDGRRFVTTPRDLATYVHYDALYEAYLNACLILLAMGTPFDPSFQALSGQGRYTTVDDKGDHHAIARQAGGFALWGGPHILTLVTEVATRALKAVRYQKFNTHLRLRPEALAARIEKAKTIETDHPTVCGRFSELEAAIDPTVKAVRARTKHALLPMAFQEGSPMHPSYGAGHAAVAGACVTILKAFFDTDTVLVRRCRPEVKTKPKDCKPDEVEGFLRYEAGDEAIQYVVDGGGQHLRRDAATCALTLEGELNKLAANIAIARNMAGVHYFSDYYDSLRLGEAVAIGVLQEQALCYPTDRFVVSVPTFDGPVVRIGAR
ncbi:MAG: bromoperoxidase [Alphaproteobacteria bacterium]|nr:bromoperoxidase [Alphaproteobacteria bacterium]MCB9697741.1 bromoperoxidase [Alphaproteobacteria bacterium]